MQAIDVMKQQNTHPKEGNRMQAIKIWGMGMLLWLLIVGEAV